MSVSGPHLRAPRGAVDGRRCAGCGTVLAADNTARLCSKCHKEKNDDLSTPPAQPRDEFFETDDFRAAFADRHIGRVFRAYRHHPRYLRILGKPLNQELLGRWLGLNQGQVSRLEKAPKAPDLTIETFQNYALILHLPQHFLWFDLPGQSRLTQSQPSRSPDNLIIPTSANDILVATTRVFEPDQLAQLRERPRDVNQDALRSLAHVLHESRRLEDRIGAAPLLEPMRGHLTLVEGLVVDSRGPLRQKVVDLGSQYAQFAAWVHAAVGNATVARQYYDRATEWALEADDPNMVSTALSMKGHLAYRLRQLAPMLGLSQAAQRDKRLTPGIRALAAQQEARALALSGEIDPCERKLNEAMELAIRASEHPEDEPPWVYFYSPEYFTMQRGRAYLYLGLHEKAADLLEAGLASMPQELHNAEWAQPYRADLDTARKRMS
jgi:hypothetical protein